MANALTVLGRWTLLLLLAGHLLFRRHFAHRNLSELFDAAGVSAPAFLKHAYVTDVCLILLAPVALWVAWQSHRAKRDLTTRGSALNTGFGAGVFIALALLGWGAGHALVALFGGGAEMYSLLRQSATLGYALIFLYAYLFFAPRVEFINQAAVFTIFICVLCAALDAFDLLKPPSIDIAYPDERMFGQQTLPIGILALALLIVHDSDWKWRGPALLALALLGWRLKQHMSQSIIPVGLAGSVLLYIAVGGILALRRQYLTGKRAVVLAMLFGVALIGYKVTRPAAPQQAAQMNSEVHAWSLKKYQELFAVYDRTLPPPEKNYRSDRAPDVPVTDPEVYKLNAVFEAAGSPSATNNMWRLLLWRRMLREWRDGRPILGQGVGNAWQYPAMYFSRFHWQPEGLDPHNSFLNLLYRYGVIGALIFSALLCAVAGSMFKALKLQPGLGDPLLEGVLLPFFFSAIFAVFFNALESPPYAMPFWFSLGLIYARARQAIHSNAESYEAVPIAR